MPAEQVEGKTDVAPDVVITDVPQIDVVDVPDPPDTSDTGDDPDVEDAADVVDVDDIDVTDDVATDTGPDTWTDTPDVIEDAGPPDVLTPQGCEVEADCNDDEPPDCHRWTCFATKGECVLIALTDWAACGDQEVCVGPSACFGGQCKSLGAPLVCDDGNECTQDECVPKSGCSFKPITGQQCEDGDPCTIGDDCAAGACVGAGTCGCATDSECEDVQGQDKCVGSLSCDAEAGQCVFNLAEPCVAPGPCHSATCDPQTGECAVEVLADGTQCSDGDACTLGDYCLSGTCQHLAAVDCDDKNECTKDSCCGEIGCDLFGCVNAPLGAGGDNYPCDDGVACNGPDYCDAGLCISNTTAEPVGDCDCASDEDCDTDDIDQCVSQLECLDGACVLVPKQVLCPPVAGGPCLINACDPGTGLCDVVAPVTGTPCDDGEACTIGDQCEGMLQCGGTPIQCADGDKCTGPATCEEGACKPGAPVKCDDGITCTNDGCDGATGCTHIGDDSKCGDGDPCKGVFTCVVGGGCQGGDPVTCDDGNSCTNDSCVEGAGCTFTPVSGGCDDGNACTANDACTDEKTCVGDPVDCDDGDPCTQDSCAVDTGCASAWTPGECYRSCAQANAAGVGSQMVTIDPDGAGPGAGFDVQCENSKNGGGWTLVVVSSDDGEDTWTWADRHLWGSEVPVGEAALPTEDHKSAAAYTLPMRDVLFVHEPSGKWAAYHDVSTTSQTLTELVLELGGEKSLPTCWVQDTDGFPMSAGNLEVGKDLCSTTLFFHAQDQNGGVLGFCPTGFLRNDAWGPGWSIKTTNGCPFDDPAAGGLGPDSGTGEWENESPARGFGGALELNDGLPNEGANRISMYVRAPLGCEGAKDGDPCDDGDPCTEKDACDEALACAGVPRICNDDEVCTDDVCELGECVFKPLDCADDDACTQDVCKLGVGCTSQGFFVAHWPMDALVDGGLPDASGNGLTLAVAAAGPVTGKNDDAMSFDGEAATLTLVQGAGLPVGAGPRSVEAWIYPVGGNTDNNTQNIVTYGKAAPGAVFTLGRSTGGLLLFDAIGGTLTGSTPLPENDWHHVAVTYDGTTVQLYVNGKFDDEKAIPLATALPEPGVPALSVGGPLGPASAFNGLIDDVAIYDRPLDPDEIAAHVTDGLGCVQLQCDGEADGVMCDDGDPCTIADTCDGGTCTGGAVVADCCTTKAMCDDFNDCTLDKCEETNTCTWSAEAVDAFPCDDGQFCTAADACTAGVCQGSPLDCSSLDAPCLVGLCDETADACVEQFKPNDTACSDGNFCSLNDFCQEGACVSNDSPSCFAPECELGVPGASPSADCAACALGAACTGVGCDAACHTWETSAGQMPGWAKWSGAAPSFEHEVMTLNAKEAGLVDWRGEFELLGDFTVEVVGIATWTGTDLDAVKGWLGLSWCGAPVLDETKLFVGGALHNQAETWAVFDTNALLGAQDDAKKPFHVRFSRSGNDVVMQRLVAGKWVVLDSWELTDDTPALALHVGHRDATADGDGSLIINRVTLCGCDKDGCGQGPEPDCDDGIVCTVDSYDPATGCEHALSPDPLVCSDGDPCTFDLCHTALLGCVHQAELGIACGSDAECDDGDACTDEACFNGTCFHKPKDCQAITGDLCHEYVCSAGSCVVDVEVQCGDQVCDPGQGCVDSLCDVACEQDADCAGALSVCRQGCCATGPAAEICDNELDDDADGETDEAACVRFVDIDADDEGDGKTWKTAFNTLPDASMASTTGNVLWVAEGKYVHIEGTAGGRVLTGVPGVDVYGGFAGGEVALHQRPWPLAETVLDGEYKVTQVAGAASGTRLDGLVLTHAKGQDGIALVMSGSAGTTVADCIFRDNEGRAVALSATPSEQPVRFERCLFHKNEDGAVDVQGDGDVEFIDSTFTNNSRPNGGGAALYLRTTTGKRLVRRCVFSGNEATLASGGAIQHQDGDVTVDGCTFDGNTAGHGPGGAILTSATGDSLLVTDSVFTGNSASTWTGGAIDAQVTAVTIKGSRFVSNGTVGGGAGGAISIHNGATLSVEDSLFSSNESWQGGAIRVDSGFDLELTGSTVRCNGGMGVTVKTTPTLIEDCDFWKNLSGAADVTLGNNEGTVERSRFAGNSSPGSGGGLSVSCGSAGSLVVRDVDFVKNEAGSKGGGLNAYCPTTVVNSTFDGNKALDGHGGGMYLSGGSWASVVVAASTFRNNTAINAGGDSSGGAAFLHSDDGVNVLNLVVHGNASDAVDQLDLQAGGLLGETVCEPAVDPFEIGALGRLYLDPTVESGCIDIGGGDTLKSYLEWQSMTTSASGALDEGEADAGRHYRVVDFDEDGFLPDGPDDGGVQGDTACTGGQVQNCEDNCPGLANADQADLDGDGVGDVCDPDIDGDDVPNADDSCPLEPNWEQGPNDALGSCDCTDDLWCTQDLYDPEIGCANPPLDECGDGDPCTDEACHALLGCVNLAEPGPDCSEDEDCDDGNACTDDACVAAGCVYRPLDCQAQEQDYCHEYVCSAGNCVVGPVVACDDQVCDPAVGCVDALCTQECSDAEGCTVTGSDVAACHDGCCVVGPQAPDNVRYVRWDAEDGGDGTSWKQAYNTVQAAMDASAHQVWIAKGTYKVVSGPVLTMKPSRAVYGGFVGNEIALVQRPRPLPETILDGDQKPGPVVNGSLLAKLDGLVITGTGNISPAVSLGIDSGITMTDCIIRNNAGPGLASDPSSGSNTYKRCVFSNNKVGAELHRYQQVIGCSFVDNWRGMIMDVSSGGSVTLSRNVFSGNIGGGGLHHVGGALSVEGCTFENNSREGAGGAIHSAPNSGQKLSVTDSIFTGNTSTLDGGAIMAATLEVTGSRFVDNHATGSSSDGGALWVAKGLTLTDSVFSSNSADHGGAVYATGTQYVEQVSVHGATFMCNESAGNGGGLYVIPPEGPQPSSSIEVSDLTFWKNEAGDKGGGAYLTLASANGHLKDSRFADNHAKDVGGGLYAYCPNYRQVVVLSTDFARNTADNGGGMGSSCRDHVNNCAFDANKAKAGSGGAIFHKATFLASVVGTSFRDNTATASGGAAYVGLTTDVTFKQVALHGNSQTTGEALEYVTSNEQGAICEPDGDPFVDGPHHELFLDPTLDPANLCLGAGGESYVGAWTTSPDGTPDEKPADAGRHYPIDHDGDLIPEDGSDPGHTWGDDSCVGGAVFLCEDNCPGISNADQADADKDGLGDVCDSTPGT